MNPTSDSARQWSRRELLRVAGLSGLTAATMSVTGGVPLSALAASAADDTPEAFLATAYATRVQAMSTGDVSKLAALYDPASSTLLAFEQERSKLFKNNLSPRWQNAPILGYSSNLQLLDLTISGSTATARLNDITSVLWIPQPMVLSPAAQAARRQNPAAYQTTSPRGPNGELTTRFGTKHDITLVKAASGWRLAKDNYDERHLFGASPDFIPGSWAQVGWGPGPFPPRPEPTPKQPSTPMGGVTPMGTTPYVRSDAVQNAHNLAFGVAAGYCYYDSCGGDCANFVSQCLPAGNQHQETSGPGHWYTYSGVCGATGCNQSPQPYAASDTWANNQYLRDWINQNSQYYSSLRGQPVASAGQLKNGDVINYHWPDGTSCQDGFEVQHTCIVVDASAGPLVAGHSPSLDNWLYSDVKSPCGYAVWYNYSTLFDYY